MGAFNWAFHELASYGLIPWALFFVIACTMTFLFRTPGIFLGHLLIAIAVVVLDVQWVQAEIYAPEWDGQPDQDAIFMLGVLIRIILINLVLLPVNVAVLLLRRFRSAQHSVAEP